MVEDGGVFVSVEKRVVSFGRYKGKPLGCLPSGYLRRLQDHSTIWAQLAKQVLRERSAFQELEEQLEKPPHTELASTINASPWIKFLDNLDTFKTGVKPNTFTSLLQWCGSSLSLRLGQRAHHQILLHGLERHLLLRSLIVQMYGECGALDDARAHLVVMHLEDTSAWNLMMKAYTQHGYTKEVLELFGLLLLKEIEPDRVTILSVLNVCGKQTLLHEARLTHHSAINAELLTDVIIGNAFITMYGKCGSLADARQVFERMLKPDIVTWNALIAASGHNGLSKVSLYLHMYMKQEGCLPDEITYVSILDACASIATLLEGHRVHVHVLALHLESRVVVGTALVNMYGKCGMPDHARQSFDRIPQRNTVCWSAMIAAYAQNERGKDALEIFSLMEQEGVRPNRVTFVSVLDACATSANLSLGEKIHDSIKNSFFAMDVKVGTALVNMYGRCGRVEDAKRIFDQVRDRDLAAWNAMIAAYAQHGQAKEAFQLFHQMKQVRVRPDMITYTSILSMCSRAGLIHEACELFASIKHDCGIVSGENHHNCMIDLLARAGKLDEAEHLIQDLSAAQEPSYVPVMTLLGACNNQKDIKRGERMAQLLFRLGQGGKDPYVMMSGIRAAHSVHKVARLARKTGEKVVKKPQGKCQIILGGREHQFIPNERSHPLMGDICGELTRLTNEMQRAGYFSCIPQKDLEAFDQWEHTVVLAAAFGLISTSPGTPLYITKDTIVCPICHMVIEFMSKACSRKISVKDASGLHRFKNGVCSCSKLK